MVRGDERHLDEINERGSEKLRRGSIPISGYRELDLNFPEFSCQMTKPTALTVVCRIARCYVHWQLQQNPYFLHHQRKIYLELWAARPFEQRMGVERIVCPKFGEMI